MANLYPRHPRKHATWGEKRVLESLQGLDDEWYVLHSVEYVRPEARQAGMGEADFVLLHRGFGMLVLEVKDGRYRVDKRRWTAVRRDGVEIELKRDPFQQAKDNRFALRNLIKEKTGIKNVPVGHCVLFTAGRPSGPLGLESPEEIVMSLPALAQPTSAVRSVLDYWQVGTWSSDEDFQLVLEALCPTSVIAPTLCYTLDMSSVDIEHETAKQIKWTNEQLAALDAASRGDRVLVLGAAGTGKTVIAQERARVLAAQGATVALIGVHRHLRLHLRRKVRLRGVTCGEPADVLSYLYGAPALAAFEGEELWVAALTLAEERGRLLDHLIVDEAQSHDHDVLEALTGLVRPGGSILLLADPYQRDAEGVWQPGGEFEKVRLTRNCRNVYPIARLVAKLSGAHNPTEGATGAKPLFTDSDDERDVVELVRDLLSDLAPDRIVVLTESGTAQRSMRHALLKARLDAAIASTLGEPGMLVSTVDHFRGCEAEAIVYVSEQAYPENRTTDYIAVSRACSYLHVIGPSARWDNVAYLMGGQP